MIEQEKLENEHIQGLLLAAKEKSAADKEALKKATRLEFFYFLYYYYFILFGRYSFFKLPDALINFFSFLFFSKWKGHIRFQLKDNTLEHGLLVPDEFRIILTRYILSNKNKNSAFENIS